MAIVSPESISTLFGPLAAICGPGLSMRREGDAVRWSLGELVAVVEARDERTIRATFADGEPVYRARPSYALSNAGAQLLAADLVAFFSGTREPRFVFAGFRESVAAPPLRASPRSHFTQS